MLTTEKRGDTRTRRWLVNASLVGCTLQKMIVRPSNGDPARILTAQITNAALGEVSHKFDGSLSPGRYQLEFEFQDAEGTIFTVPTRGYYELLIEQDLG